MSRAHQITGQSQGNAAAIMARSEDIIASIESIEEMLGHSLQRQEVDSVQWFFTSAFINDLSQRILRLRGQLDQCRPNSQIRRMLAESYIGIAN